MSCETSIYTVQAQTWRAVIQRFRVKENQKCSDKEQKCFISNRSLPQANTQGPFSTLKWTIRNKHNKTKKVEDWLLKIMTCFVYTSIIFRGIDHLDFSLSTYQ